jgi:hypothetical protein
MTGHRLIVQQVSQHDSRSQKSRPSTFLELARWVDRHPLRHPPHTATATHTVSLHGQPLSPPHPPLAQKHHQQMSLQQTILACVALAHAPPASNVQPGPLPWVRSSCLSVHILIICPSLTVCQMTIDGTPEISTVHLHSLRSHSSNTSMLTLLAFLP